VDSFDRDLQTLDAAKHAWARLAVERKIALLEGVKRAVYRLGPEWVRLATAAKGLRVGSPLAGEEWISGPWAVLYAINRYLRTLRAISATGESPVPHASRRAGRTVVNVFPHDFYDRVLLSGISAQVWMQRGVMPDDIRVEAAELYKLGQPAGRVALVLGAGNIASIAPLDVLYKLFAAGSVCMLKLNPINTYLGPLLERAFSAFVDAGYLRFAYGGADIGASLCAHPLVEEIHITGSEATHKAIVGNIGTGKRLTSELGNVSPTIVLPGPWNAADIAFQAEHIATQKAHNAGFNCIAAQVLILPKAWPDSAALYERIARAFETMENRPEYYPGAAQRRAALAGENAPPRSIVEIDPAQADPAFTTEAFCGVLATVGFDGDLQTYVRRAVEFANERLQGSLGAQLIVHPATIKAHASIVSDAIAQLRYGCVGVNAWTGVGYFLTETPWGAYPGNTLENVGSGIGVVHNSYFLTRTEKSVVQAPFTPFPRSMRSGEYTLLPRPPWFVTNSMQAEIGRALCDFEMSPSPGRAAHIAALAMRG
jgi:aldehyde dehydrogenase (NAD(P)+)